ncbi:MAG: pectate lyase [Armatimonadota bacterium]
MRAVRICAVMLLVCCAAGQAAEPAWDDALYQQAGRALRAAVDALAAEEAARGEFRSTAWEKGLTHVSLYLDVYRVTGARKYLDWARVAADWLIAARQPSGGYAHEPYIRELGSAQTFPTYVTFRDGRDLSAVRAVFAVYDAGGGERYLRAACETADFLLQAQYECGAWPSVWPPPERGWLRLPMLNDGVTVSQARVLIQVYRRTGAQRYLAGIRRAGEFLVQWQLPEPAPGWAQQYDLDRRPAWGRVFEPASVCGLPSANAVDLLIDIHLTTGDERYLGPIPRALAWLEQARTAPNEWARFYEPGTGRPIYARSQHKPEISYTREVLYRGYAQFGDWGVDRIAARWRRLQELGRDGLLAAESTPPTPDELRRRIADLEPRVRGLVAPDGVLGGYPANGADLSALAGAMGCAARYLEAVQRLRRAGEQ